MIEQNGILCNTFNQQSGMSLANKVISNLTSREDVSVVYLVTKVELGEQLVTMYTKSIKKKKTLKPQWELHITFKSNVHQGLDFWNQNDSFLNLNDRASKRPFFNIRSKIPHKFANLVLICESQSNQRRPNLTWDLGFAFIDQMVPVNNWLQVIDQFDV